jgi:hypothetical protein
LIRFAIDLGVFFNRTTPVLTIDFIMKLPCTVVISLRSTVTDTVGQKIALLTGLQRFSMDRNHGNTVGHARSAEVLN